MLNFLADYMINYQKIIMDLEKQIKGEIVYDPKILEKYSTDASLFTVMPSLIIYPKDKWDISKIVKYVHDLKLESLDVKSEKYRKFDDLSITARAAGTCMSGGSLNNSIILDVTKYLNKIEMIGKDFVICEPGLYYRDMEKETLKHNLFLGSYPASKDLCCIGGIVANNSAGEKSLLYGQTVDYVEEIEMVMSDGEIRVFNETSGEYKNIFDLINKNKDEILKNEPRVTKNSSGYFLWKLLETNNLSKIICGSQGTFGIITKVKIKLVEAKPKSQMLTVLMPNFENLVELVEEVLKYKPESIETYDDQTFKIVMKFLPTILWKLKGSIFQLAYSFLPEVKMVLFSGIPKLIMLIEFTGQTQAEVDKKAKECLTHIIKFKYSARVSRSDVERNKYWLFRRESFNLLRSKLKDFRTAPFIEDTIVPIENMKTYIPEIQEILKKHNFINTIAGHAGNGNFHIIPLMKMQTQSEVNEIIQANSEVFELVQKYGGSLSAEHNDGLVRTPYLHYMFTAKMLNLFQDVKNIFDPLNIFNPGKKVGGSIVENYAKIKLIK